MTTKPPDLPDMNALAMEACDMWQQHLSNLANDPSARAELTRFLEPQRRIFADWASMMQQGQSHASTPETENAPPSTPKTDVPPEDSRTEFRPASPASTPSGVAASGDDPLRVAQLALRLAELEKRVAALESRAANAAR